jgi:hypothetical protein
MIIGGLTVQENKKKINSLMELYGLIGLLWSLQEGDSLLLLEEPELSLNSAIVSRIPALDLQIAKTKKEAGINYNS